MQVPSSGTLFGSPAQAMHVRMDGGVPVVPPPVDAGHPIQFDTPVRACDLYSCVT